MATPPEPLERDLGWLLARASHVFTTEATAALEELGISPRAQCVLKVASTGEHTQIELARAVGLDKTTMVVTLDELEEQGLARRIPSSKDRRARVIEVTDAGGEMVRRADAIIARVQADVLAALPSGQREALVDGLSRLVRERLAEPAECARPVRRPAAA